MKNILGGKDKYKCLYSFIKREQPILYNAINDLCIDSIFKNQKYKNTFLMPSEKLSKHILKLVDNDKDDEATLIIKSLLLKGHHTPASMKDDINIGTVNNKLIKSVSTLKSLVVKSNKGIYDKDGELTTNILIYSGEKEPEEYIDDKIKISPERIVYKPRNGGCNAEIFKNITNKLMVKGNVKQTLNNFYHAVAKLLSILKGRNELHKAYFYLSPNPILSWHFLCLHGSDHSLITDNDLKDFKLSVYEDINIITTSLNAIDFSKSLYSEINKLRSKILSESCDKSSISSAIIKAYHDISKGLDDKLKGLFPANINEKLLMDECRFIYDECIDSYAEIEDMNISLNSINWNSPKNHLIISDKAIYQNLIKSTEAFVSGPVLFLKSVYFIYMPITDEIKRTLTKAGGKSGGGSSNPSSIRSAIFRGAKAHEELLQCTKDTPLEKLIKELSIESREKLKNILNNVQKN
jgi:hypothetical protein